VYVSPPRYSKHVVVAPKGHDRRGGGNDRDHGDGNGRGNDRDDRGSRGDRGGNDRMAMGPSRGR